jgi:predicted nucleic acid-binding protein
MKFLLDTNVISELRKIKTGKINPNVKAWAETVLPSQLSLSVVTLLELEMGIGLIERRDVAQAALLRTWLNHHVLPTFDGRIIVIDVATTLCCVVVGYMCQTRVLTVMH